MEALNITVGLVSLGLAVFSIILSLKWSNEAARNLDRAQAALEEVRRETTNVSRAVEDRLRDLIDRVVPSTEDQFAGQAMAALLNGSLEIDKLAALADMAAKAGASSPARKQQRRR